MTSEPVSEQREELYTNTMPRLKGKQIMKQQTEDFHMLPLDMPKK